MIYHAIRHFRRHCLVIRCYCIKMSAFMESVKVTNDSRAAWGSLYHVDVIELRDWLLT